jgi:hypothetical protein
VWFVLTFLSTNTSEVNPGISMWDYRYSNLYFVAGILALTPAYVIAYPFMRDWTAQRWHRRGLWSGIAFAALGALLWAWTYLDGSTLPAGQTVLTAFTRSVAVYLVAVGMTLVLLRWVWSARWR